MATKQITSNSTPLEIRTAQEQLSQAQQEFNTLYREKFNNQGASAADISRAAAQIASKYDYVDFGQTTTLSNGEINVGGDQFFVKGLGNNTNSTYTPAAKTLINSDDAFPVTKPSVTVTPTYNKPGVSPNEPKRNQNISTDTAPLSATQSPQVKPDTNATSPGLRDASEAGAAIENRTKASSLDAFNGIVNQNPNNVNKDTPSGNINNYLKDPLSLNINRPGNADDAGKISNNIEDTSDVTAFPDPGAPSSGPITYGTTKASTAQNTQAGTQNNAAVKIRPNILHSYANWTYKIGLYLLSASDYNVIIQKGQVTAESRKYPIAISGGYTKGTSKVNLERDFYIQSLRFTSIIGNKMQSTATNNIDLEMEIFEPYGASFIGEVGALAATVNDLFITIAENPFLVEIDFTGYKDDGSVVPSILGNGKKFIPVKIISIDMKLDAAGARYTLQMVPYSFYAFTQKKTALTKDAWVYGETVDDILGNNSDGLIGRLNAIELEKVQKDQVQELNDIYSIKYYSFNQSGTNTEELGKSKVAFPTEGGPATIIKNRAIDENNPTKQGYTIKSGTLIKEAIKDLVLVSEYFNLRMNPDGEANQDNNKPAELLKVIPQIKLTDQWDNKRNEYRKEITFHVFNTLLFGENFPNGGLAPIKSWGYSKEYNYIFTGKNADILNLDINFNLLYYTKFFTDKNELGTILTDVVANRSSTAAPVDIFNVSERSTVNGGIGRSAPNEPSRYINASLAAEFFDNKMNNSFADMISVDMDIIGDPEWIPQDASIIGGEFKIGDINTKLDKNNSIAIDVAGAYVKLQLRTPRDYNDASGLVDLNTDESYIGGVYQVITVDNLFQDGKFTSKLNMIKVPNQEDNVKKTTSATGPGGMFG